MKKLSLALAFAGILSTATFAGNVVTLKDQDGKQTTSASKPESKSPKKKHTAKKAKAEKKAEKPAETKK